MKQILVSGVTVLDFVHTVDEMPAKAEKYVSPAAGIVVGGCAANAAIAVARLEGKAILHSKLGDDVIGTIILDRLQQEGVDCSAVIQPPDSRSSFSSIFVDASGERLIVNYRGNKLEIASPNQSVCTEPDAVLVDTRWDAGALCNLEIARQCQVPAVVDAEDPVNPDVVAIATHTAFSRQGLRQFSATDDIESGLRAVKAFSPGWHCVTDGQDGCYFLHQDKLTRIPAPKVNAVDTLGAGDVWHGAFVLQLAEGQDEATAVEFANTVAALKCTRAGGGDSCPTRQEVAEHPWNQNTTSDPTKKDRTS